MRRVVEAGLLLVSLALIGPGCHASMGSVAPTLPSPAARFDALVDELLVLDEEPSPYDCAALDAGFSSLAETGIGNAARYARAELALRCGDTQAWLDHHEALARAGYLASLTLLTNEAIARRDWSRALAVVERLADEPEGSARGERAVALRAALIHARWVDRGDPEDFRVLERAAKHAIVRAPAELDPRADLIRLYVEQSALTGEGGPLLLAQLSEREARRIARARGSSSPRLELVSGFVRELEGRRIEAIAAWERALELNAALVEPRLWLGLAAIDRRDFGEALDQLQRYVDVYPEHVDALLALGVAARGAGDLSTAEDAYARAAARDPSDPRPHWNTAMLLVIEPETGRPSAEDLDRHAQSLHRFRALADASASCPARTDARPDPACVSGAAELEHALSSTPALLETADSYAGRGSDPYGELERRAHELMLEEQRNEAERIERLRELERQATPVATPQ